MIDCLVVVADGQIMGLIRRSRGGRLELVYDEEWRFRETAYPLSLSMPLVVAQHGHDRVEPWLWGLLPDNDAILSRWGQRFHVSPRNAFALLGMVGEDCPGAIQLVRPERVDLVLENDDRKIEWLTKADIAERLRILRMDQGAWRLDHDAGQFSLAGAQPKTALYFDGQRWGVPYDSVPTTHILKPPLATLHGHTENEHLCLELAGGLGLNAVRTEVCSFEGERAIVVERYDRYRSSGSVKRLHQEDMCQALGISPTRKYQNDGGPGCAQLSNVIWTHSVEPMKDAWALAHATMLNWIIGGTDAHAKNYSMLIGPSGRSRLSPLYDIASLLPYSRISRNLKMATKVGGEYRLGFVRSRHWERFASELRLPPAEVLEMGMTMARSLPDVLGTLIDETEGIGHPRLREMTDRISAHAKDCCSYLKDATS